MEIKLTAEQFKELYMTNKVSDLAKQFEVSPNTLVKKAKELGINKPRGRAKNTLVIE